jgi:hypothetical protein
MDEGLHRALKAEAGLSSMSVNELCCLRLELPSILERLPAETSLALRAARKVGGKDLVAMVLFGSWARGTPRDNSDVDLLIVMKPGTTINRAVYRKWQDIAPDLKVCEPHFVALPSERDYVSGLWAEIAIDGQILMDGTNQVTQYLNQVRRAMVEGKLLAKKIHGQTYWVRNEVA